MQLKRLEISGFKSFADKCAIDFPPGISAIVGPNGCGKSNIIDAIKWVMGEQSVRQLRGKSMGDVIFAGTDRRPPLNMAEVSLVIAGHDPHTGGNIGEYAEIMVTRRLYRSGESRYLINRQPCRLKDISDIFLRFSMGSRSCAIIQQGNIGAITDASPEERRAFIEEAAGVVRYKARKQEAVSKVSATRDNIVRLNDILEEIESRLAELTVAAEKARRYRDCRDRLKQADMMIACYYHERYARKIESVEKLLESLKENTGDKTGEIERLNEALREIEDSRREMEDAIAAKKAEKETKQKKTETIDFECRRLGDELERTREENDRRIQSLEELSEKNKTIRAEQDGEIQKEQSLRERIQTIKNEIHDEKEKTAAHREQLSEKGRVLEEKKETLMALSNRHARYQNSFQNASENRENLERRIVKTRQEKKAAEKTVSELEAAENDAAGKMDSIQQRLDDLKRRKSECETVLKEKSAALSEKTRSIGRIENERSRLKSRLTILSKMEAGFEWYRDGVRAIMNHRGEIDPDGRIRAVIAEIIDPEEGYADAVEAALGESLQYIVVDGPKAGKDCIRYLEDNESGRCGFLFHESRYRSTPQSPSKQAEPVSRPAPASAGKTDKAAPGMLADHVCAQAGYEQLVRHLLADIAVADDLDDALCLWDSGNGYAAVVTPQGEMVSKNGAMVGGSRDNLSGILEKKQEIRQLQQAIETIGETLESEQSERKGLEAEVKNLENRLSDITQKKFRYEADHLEAEKKRYRTTEQLKHARRHLEITALERERLEGEKEDVEEEIERHDQLLAEIAGDMEAEKEQIDAATRDIEGLKETIRTFDNRLVDQKLELTRLESEMDNTRRSLTRLREFLREGTEREEKTRTAIDEGENRMAEIEKQLAAYTSEKAREASALRQIAGDLKDEEARYREVVEKKQTTGSALSDARTHVEKNREKIHKLELELSGLQINRENTVNRFLERYSDPFSAVLEQFSETVRAPGFSIELTEKQRLEARTEMEEIGEVSLGAIEACEQQQARRDFLVEQRNDLEKALADLENVIRKINRITRSLFLRTFEQINARFSELFPRLFNGGAAWLELTSPDSPLETGVELMIQPPGKKLSRLSLLSGGEKALSAIAFIFSIFMLNPASFCLLDEIDAPLDDANVHRFNELLRIIGEETQIIMISHKKKTMEFSDVLFGITIAKNGGSRMIPVNLDQALDVHRKQQNAAGEHHHPNPSARTIQ